ncbi:hypothetical protein ACROYT_G027982 [Oculina patagonica]
MEALEQVGVVTPPTNVGLKSSSVPRTWLTVFTGSLPPFRLKGCSLVIEFQLVIVFLARKEFVDKKQKNYFLTHFSKKTPGVHRTRTAMKATLCLVIFVMILFCVGETAVLKPERFETEDIGKRASPHIQRVILLVHANLRRFFAGILARLPLIYRSTGPKALDLGYGGVIVIEEIKRQKTSSCPFL